MIDSRFIFVGALFQLIGGLSYLVATVRGKVQPNRITWFLWAFAPLLAFFAELQQGVGIQSLLTFLVGFNPLLIFLASFVNKSSVWKIGRLDIICGLLSLVGLLLWYVTHDGTIAIVCSILADCFAGIPTVVKAYKAPETESGSAFFFGTLFAIITLLTIKTWSLASFGFPVYILLMNLLLVVLIFSKVGKRLA